MRKAVRIKSVATCLASMVSSRLLNMATTYMTGRLLRRAAFASALLAVLAAKIGGTISLPIVAMNALLYAELIALFAASALLLIDMLRRAGEGQALSRGSAAAGDQPSDARAA